ncbi:MAG TPA: hypothetical protein VK850_00200 [Candidatus Binatia bacterium]|nr:hypothetical protein [Candidatus Binatia bacterium]
MANNRALWMAGLAVLLTQATFGALQPTVLPVTYAQYGSSVAVGPQNTLVVWVDYRRTMDLTHETFGTRVGPLGETLDGDGIPLTGNCDGRAGVAALGGKFLIVWSKGPNIYARRMTSAGELLDAQPIVVTANPGHPYPELVLREFSVAADGVNFWVAWCDDRSMPAGTPEYQRYDYQDIYAARISPAGRVLDARGIPICTRHANQTSPKLSPRADFIVWVDQRPTKQSIFGARLHPKGFALDAQGFPIMSSTNQYSSVPDVSGNGRGWLVVWGEPTAIYGAQVNRTRTVSRPFQIAPATQLTPPQVETAGQDCLVLWQSGASILGTHVATPKQAGRIVPIATDDSGAAYFSLGGFGGNGTRFFVTGATAPTNGSWFDNDVWFGQFSPGMLP